MNELHMKILTIIIIVAFPMITNAQDTDGEISVYSRAIRDFISYRQSHGMSSSFYLEAVRGIEHELFNDGIKDDGVTLINYKNQKQIYRQNNNKLTHHVIFPAKVKNDQLKITITPYHDTRKGSSYNLLVSDEYDVIYKFNCESGQYEFEKIEEWGI